MAQPTLRQVGFLVNRGIVVPPTKAACSTLIEFVLKGNATLRDDESARIALVKNCQERWIGKRVKIIRGAEDGKFGKVLYILARRRDQVEAMKRCGVDFHPNPFTVAVCMDKGGLLTASCSAIELV